MNVLPILHIHLKALKSEYKPYPPKEDKSLGAVLKRKRLNLEWTQKDTTQHFKVKKGAYENWELNIHRPNKKKWNKINEFLGFEFWKIEDDLASELVKFRVKHKLRQKDLADRIGVSLRTVEKIEQRQKEGVSQKMIIRIIEYLRKH